VQSRVCSDFAPINWYDRFITGPDVMRFSPEQKFRLAVTNVVNPFNLGTIVGEAGIEVAANSHSPYGPGVYGWAKLSGTNLTQDMTDQFFGTFLIPSITHTDPHYHRQPDFSIPHRIWHCIDQIVWQRDDSGGPQLQLLSDRRARHRHLHLESLCARPTDAPQRRCERYVVGLATAPIDNFITEFVPRSPAASTPTWSSCSASLTRWP